jgi:thioesterase domain-containing protein
MNDDVERYHRISYSLWNKKALLKAADPEARKPFFFVASQGLSGRLGDRHAVFTIPTWPILSKFSDIDMLATRFLEHIDAADPVGPYRLGGFCFGGVVAFEMARKLAAAGRQIDLLALVETPFPDPDIRRAQVVRTIRRLLVASIYPSELTSELATRSRRFLGRVRRGGPDERERYERHHARCVHEALANYTPRTYPGRLTLFLGDRSPFRYFTVSGWRKLAEQGIEVQVIPGNHQGVLHGSELARQVERCLDGLDPMSDLKPSSLPRDA